MKEHEEKVIERAERITLELEKSPILRELRANEATEILTKRQAAAARIEDLQLDLEACGVLKREIEAMEPRIVELEKEKKALLAEIGNRRSRFYLEKLGIEGAIKREEEILLSCYDSQIDEKIRFFQERFEAIRHSGINSQKQAETTIETKTITTFSNAESSGRVLAYCLEVIRQLEAMRLEPFFDPAKVERLRAEEPDADRLEEYAATKGRHNDEPGPGLLAAMRRATDNQIDFTIGQINEKVKKLLTPKKRAGARK